MVWLKQHLVVRVAFGDTSDNMDVNIGRKGRGKVAAELIAGAYPVPLWAVGGVQEAYLWHKGMEYNPFCLSQENVVERVVGLS